MAKVKTVKITLNYDSDYENFLYKAGKEYEVDEKTAERLKQINEMLIRENT